MPGVIVDPASKRVFVMRDNSTFEAVTFAGRSKKLETPLWLSVAGCAPTWARRCRAVTS